MKLFTETQMLLSHLAKSGGSMTFAEDEIPYSEEAMAEAKRVGLAKICGESGWGTTETLELTRAGRLHCGLAVPPSFAGRIKSWWLGTTYSR
jgi:hypothetical protein